MELASGFPALSWQLATEPSADTAHTGSGGSSSGGLFGDSSSPDRSSPYGWDFLGSVPVPTRQRVRDGVATLLRQQRQAGGPPLRCCFPMGQGGHSPLERLRRIRRLDDFPKMLVSVEQGNIFNRRFFRQHVSSDTFTDALPADIDPRFAEAGLVDPLGQVGVFAVAPFLLLVDRQKLGNLPVPRRWADLLDPCYRQQVVLGGWRRPGEQRWRQFNQYLLLSFARDFGLNGLRALLANVSTLLHSAQMPRLAGTDNSPGGIYVVPWSLADICPRRTHTEVVWPEDGALVWPLWMTVQSSHRERLAPLVDHFYGPALAGYLNDNRYPSCCKSPDTASPLPAGATMRWPGWEVIRHPATAGDLRVVRQIFGEVLPCV